MKKVILLLVLALFACKVDAQKTVFDDVFSEYKNKKGFMVMDLSGDFLSMFMGDKKKKLESLPVVNGIRLLVQEDKGAGIKGFCKDLKKRLDMSQYKVLMKVRSKGSNVLFLSNKEEKKIQDFYMLVEGDNDVLICLSGDFTSENAIDLMKDFKFGGNGKKKN